MRFIAVLNWMLATMRFIIHSKDAHCRVHLKYSRSRDVLDFYKPLETRIQNCHQTGLEIITIKNIYPIYIADIYHADRATKQQSLSHTQGQYWTPCLWLMQGTCHAVTRQTTQQILAWQIQLGRDRFYLLVHHSAWRNTAAAAASVQTAGAVVNTQQFASTVTFMVVDSMTTQDTDWWDITFIKARSRLGPPTTEWVNSQVLNVPLDT